MKNIRLGLVGAGKIVQVCCKSIHEHEGVSIEAATDVHAGRLKQVCEEQEIKKAYRTADELFADDEIDAVYIAVPNKFHAPLAIAALEAGKHVLLDKPFTRHLDEAEKVAQVARKSDKVFMLGMNQRYVEDCQKVRSLVADGALGEVYHAKAYWLRREGIPRLGTWFGNKELAGGGCLYDIGVHMLDLAMFTMNNWKPVSVFGKTYSKFGHRGLGEGGWGASDREGIEFDVDDFATALIKFENGATITLDVTWARHHDENDTNDVNLFGTEGGAQCYPCKLFRRDPLRKEYDIIEDVNAEVPLEHCDRFHNFLNVIQGTEEPLTTLDQALTVQKVLDAIYESSKTGEAVDVR